MSLIAEVLEHNTLVPAEILQQEISPILVDREQIINVNKAKNVLLVFTNRRLILALKADADAQKPGLVEYITLPYKSIATFSKEGNNLWDLDAKLNIWVNAMPRTISVDFGQDSNINEAYMFLSKFVLGGGY